MNYYHMHFLPPWGKFSPLEIYLVSEEIHRNSPIKGDIGTTYTLPEGIVALSHGSINYLTEEEFPSDSSNLGIGTTTCILPEEVI